MWMCEYLCGRIQSPLDRLCLWVVWPPKFSYKGSFNFACRPTPSSCLYLSILYWEWLLFEKSPWCPPLSSWPRRSTVFTLEPWVTILASPSLKHQWPGWFFVCCLAEASGRRDSHQRLYIWGPVLYDACSTPRQLVSGPDDWKKRKTWGKSMREKSSQSKSPLALRLPLVSLRVWVFC